MAYTAKQKSYVDAYADNYLRVNGLTRRDLLDSYEAQQAYNNALARYVAANPQIFDGDQIASANIIRQMDAQLDSRGFWELLATNTTADWVGLGFVIDDSLKRVEGVNPFTANPQTTMILALAAIVTVSAVIAYKVTPKIPQK